MGMVYKCTAYLISEDEDTELMDTSLAIEEIDEETQEQLPNDNLVYFHVLAYNFEDAFMKIVKFIEIESEMGEYEILKIEALPEINIINVYNGSEKNCPYCSSEEAFPDDIMTFKCPRCKHLIRVSDNGWENILCESCKESITRSKVQLIKGKYIYKK